MTERDIEKPPEDVAEQSRGLLNDDEEASQGREVPLEEDEADAAEQARAVDLDEDEYR